MSIKPVIEVLSINEAVRMVGSLVADLLYHANTVTTVDDALDLAERAGVLTELMCSVQHAALRKADLVTR